MGWAIQGPYSPPAGDSYSRNQSQIAFEIAWCALAMLRQAGCTGGGSIAVAATLLIGTGGDTFAFVRAQILSVTLLPGGSHHFSCDRNRLGCQNPREYRFR